MSAPSLPERQALSKTLLVRKESKGRGPNGNKHRRKTSATEAICAATRHLDTKQILVFKIFKYCNLFIADMSYIVKCDAHSECNIYIYIYVKI